MPNRSSNQFRLDKVKKLAKRLSKSKDIPLSHALEEISIQLGYSTWFECRKAILSGEKKEELSPRTGSSVFPYQYDPARDKVEEVVGVSANANGGFDVQERKSVLNFIGENFESASTLRSRLEDEIKRVISNSKTHSHVYIYLFIDSDAISLLRNIEGFFDKILDRFPRLTNLEVIHRDQQLTLDEWQEFINELNKEPDL